MYRIRVTWCYHKKLGTNPYPFPLQRMIDLFRIGKILMQLTSLFTPSKKWWGEKIVLPKKTRNGEPIQMFSKPISLRFARSKIRLNCLNFQVISKPLTKEKVTRNYNVNLPKWKFEKVKGFQKLPLKFSKFLVWKIIITATFCHGHRRIK